MYICGVMAIENIVLNIPHSSKILAFPEKWNGNIDEEISKWTDTATDLLFRSNDERIVEHVCPFSRFTVDVERLVNDDLNKEGNGIVYKKFNGKTRELTELEETALMSLYHSYIEGLKEKITGEGTLLIDCHSFPRDLSDIDICIGYNDDWSKPSEKVLDTIVSHFQGLGYKVGINEPYANSISPEKEFKYQSVMIEVNKRVYLNDKDEPDNFMYKYNAVMQNLYKKLFILKD